MLFILLLIRKYYCPSDSDLSIRKQAPIFWNFFVFDPRIDSAGGAYEEFYYIKTM